MITDLKPKAKVAIDRFPLDPYCRLYLPLRHLDGDSFMSKDAYGHVCTRHADAHWTPQGWSLDGVGDYLSVPTHRALDIADAITIEAWIYKNSEAGNIYQRIVQKGNANQAYGLTLEGTATLKARFYLSGADTAFVLQTNFQYDNWKHAVTTYDSHYVRGYVDGVNVYTSTDQNSAIGITTNHLQIGRRGDALAITYFNGLIGLVSIYNRALTPQESSEHYLVGKELFT